MSCGSPPRTGNRRVPLIDPLRHGLERRRSEARHAAAVALFLTDGKPVKGKMGITPDGPFDVPFSKDKVLAAVKKTGFIVG